MLKGVTEKIRNIKIGDELTIKANPLRKINTVRSIVSRLNVTEPESGKIFSCTTDIDGGIITIKANKR